MKELQAWIKMKGSHVLLYSAKEEEERSSTKLSYLSEGAAAPLDVGRRVRALQQLHGIVHSCGRRKTFGLESMMAGWCVCFSHWPTKNRLGASWMFYWLMNSLCRETLLEKEKFRWSAGKQISLHVNELMEYVEWSWKHICLCVIRVTLTTQSIPVQRLPKESS